MLWFNGTAPLEVVQILAIIFGPGAGAYAGIRFALNGLREGQKRIEATLADRSDRLETKLEDVRDSIIVIKTVLEREK